MSRTLPTKEQQKKLTAKTIDGALTIMYDKRPLAIMRLQSIEKTELGQVMHTECIPVHKDCLPAESETQRLHDENAVLRREIDRICAKFDEAREAINSAIRLNEIEETGRLRIESAWRSERDEARAERDEAIRERDEVRRWFCRGGLRTERAARTTASKRNWDCFKEETA